MGKLGKPEKSGEVMARSMLSIVSIALLALLLAACDTPSTPAPTLRGALVPTRSTPTPTATLTPSNTPTFTATFTPSNTLTPTRTFTFTATPTNTATFTPTFTPSPTASWTPPPTDTLTFTPSPTPDASTTPGGPTETPAPIAAIPIRAGDVINGNIGDVGEVHYSFTARANDIISARMEFTSGNLDPYLLLLDSSGAVIDENDDRATDTRDSELDSVVIPADGTYTLVATRFQRELGSTRGDFVLTFVEGALPEIVEPIETETLAYGDTVHGAIDNENWRHLYSFEARAGDVVTISLSRVTGNLDTNLILQNEAGDILTQNDDVNESIRDSEITAFTIRESGVYTIIVTRFQAEEGDSQGEFSLTLTLEAGTGA